jgi:hypothetical protein
VNEVPGPIKDGDSHWCEMAGIYAILTMVKIICEKHKVEQGKITVCCDNMSALKVFDPSYFPDPKHKNFDLVCACWQLKKDIPIK